MKLIHERASEIDPSTRSSQERLRRMRIGERIQIEAFALVPDRNRDLVRGAGDPHDHLFLPVKPIAVNMALFTISRTARPIFSRLVPWKPALRACSRASFSTESTTCSIEFNVRVVVSNAEFGSRSDGFVPLDENLGIFFCWLGWTRGARPVAHR